MVSVPRHDTPLPKNAALRWLTDAGPDVPARIRSRLLDEMVAAPRATFAGPINGVILNVLALCMHAGRVFWILLVLEATLLALRFTLSRRARRNHAEGRANAPDGYLILAASWCALEGTMAFNAMASGVTPLRILFAASILALTGPICARNYGAPRFAMLLVSLCYLPLVAGAQLTSEPWFLVMLAQVPLLFMGAGDILRRYNRLAITALMAQAHSTHRAAHDSLTGLLNRAGLAERLAEVNWGGAPCALFYIDLDGFKPVNDTFGHAAGDLMLVAVADRLRACARKSDIVARLGGDEFVLVVPRIVAAEAECLAERIVRQISEPPYLLDSYGSLRVAASVGFACYPDDGDAIADLLRKADAALYDAKGAGRGTWRRFTELDSPESLASDHYAIPR